MTKKFKRNPRARRRAGRTDRTGTVQVTVYLRGDRGAYIKGNVFRGYSIIDAKVSDVAEAIESALFERRSAKPNGRAHVAA